MDQETIDRIHEGLAKQFQDNYVTPENALLVLIAIFTTTMEKAGFSESFLEDTFIVIKRDFLRKRANRLKDSE